MDDSSKEQAGDWRKGKRRAERLALRRPSAKLIDVSFFAPLSELANTLRNLVDREGYTRFPSSPICTDIAVMLNQLRETFNLLCFINADLRRDNDSDYRPAYSFVSLPLVRTLIDGFYNITVLLDDPSKARTFRISGYKRMLDALKAEEKLYGDEPGWPEYIQQQRSFLRTGLTSDGFTEEMLQQNEKWILLGPYLRSDPEHDRDHKKLMRRFVHGHWAQYSEISHLTFRGIHELFGIMNIKEIAHRHRHTVREGAERELAQHLGRAAAIMLALLTEIQAVFQFKGHNVNSRLHAFWRGAVNFKEGEEIHDRRYKALMASKHIEDTPSANL